MAPGLNRALSLGAPQLAAHSGSMTTAARACPSCRTPLPEEAHFCLNCGAATPTEPGVPARTMPTDISEIARVRKALSAEYAIERVLGEGGMATVYLATDLK